MAPPDATPAEHARARRAAQLIGTASIEISPRDDPVRDELGELLAPETTVFVNHPGTSPITTSSPLASGCAAPASSRCRMSRRGGSRASPRRATFCGARPATPG